MMGLGFFGMGGFGLIWMLLFWIGVIVLAIWLVGLLFPLAKTQNKDENSASSSATEILRERYAKGELTTEQFQEMLKTIKQ